jgi:uncharacterized caspase-like protein
MKTIIFSIILFVAATTGAQAERRVALVLGNERYSALRPLENPLNDAYAIEEVLLSLGFEVWVETNRNLKRMRRAVRDFQEDAQGADVALFFYAGHGMEVEGQNHLMPVDADGETLEQLRQTSLPLEEVAQALRSVSPRSIMIIDACRTDAFAGNTGRSGIPLKARQDLRAGMGRMGQAKGLIYAFASAPGAAALDGTGENSPFTTALVRHLGTSGIELRSAFTLVQQEVYDRTRGKQLPYVESGLPQLVFAAGPSSLPERERLLLAMSQLSLSDRAAVEQIAAKHDMPLAPLFSALISQDAKALPALERDTLLTRAAQRYTQLQDQIRQLSAADPRVSALRSQALDLLDQGAFQSARTRLAEAIELDAKAAEEQIIRIIFRLTSQAESRLLLAYMLGTQDDMTAARTELLAALDLFDQTFALHDGLMPDELNDAAFRMLYDANIRLGDLQGALEALQRRKKLIRIWYDAAPKHRKWLTNLSETFNLIASVQFQLGNMEQAIQAKRGELATQAYMADLDDAPPERWWALVEQLEHLARDAKDKGFPQQAKPVLHSGLSILDTLVDGGHDTQRTQYGFAVFHQHLGDLAMAEDGRAEAAEAQEHFARFAQIAQAQLDTPDPQFPWVEVFLISKSRQAQQALSQNAPDTATAHLQEALRLTQGKRAPVPAQSQAAYQAALIHLTLSELLPQDSTYMTQARAVSSALLQQNLLTPEQQKELAQAGLPRP